MATRSNIGILNSDGTVDYIYCHFDGYLDHNGKILNKYYTTEDKVRELIKLGDLSILGPEIGEKQDFDDTTTHNNNWCLVYGRDRGEENTQSKNCSYTKYSNDNLEDYTYLFIPNKGWQFRQYGRQGWSDLNETLNLS